VNNHQFVIDISFITKLTSELTPLRPFGTIGCEIFSTNKKIMVSIEKFNDEAGLSKY